MAAKSLAEIINDHLAVEAMEGEEDPQVLHDTLEGIEANLADKTDAICGLLNHWRGTEDTLAKEIARLQDRKRMFQNRQGRLKSYLKYSVSRLNDRRVETELHTVSIRKGSLSVMIDDLDQLPSEYTETVTSAMKSAIKSALTTGQNIPGARLVRGEDSVMIR